jgi:hypothetical protein
MYFAITRNYFALNIRIIYRMYAVIWHKVKCLQDGQFIRKSIFRLFEFAKRGKLKRSVTIVQSQMNAIGQNQDVAALPLMRSPCIPVLQRGRGYAAEMVGILPGSTVTPYISRIPFSLPKPRGGDMIIALIIPPLRGLQTPPG